MITLEQFSLSLALALISAFVAGAGFGVWLSVFILARAPRLFRADQTKSGEVDLALSDYPGTPFQYERARLFEIKPHDKRTPP